MGEVLLTPRQLPDATLFHHSGQDFSPELSLGFRNSSCVVRLRHFCLLPLGTMFTERSDEGCSFYPLSLQRFLADLLDLGSVGRLWGSDFFVRAPSAAAI